MRHRSQRPVSVDPQVDGRRLPDPVDAWRPSGSRAGHARRAYGLGYFRAAVDWFLGELWSRHGESQSAIVRGAGAGAAVFRRADLVVGLSAGRAFGNAGDS